MRKFHNLADLQRQDAEAAEHKATLWERSAVWGPRARDLTAILAIGATLLSGAARLFEMYRARSLSPAVEPATGIASTTVDRVPVPR
jgi:hypothetical protein